MYPMSVKAVIHARMARISETRNTTCFGAFKVGMLPPVKRLGLGLQSGSFWLLAVKLALTQARVHPPLLGNFDARQPSNDEKISDKRMSRRSCAHPQNYHRYLAE